MNAYYVSGLTNDTLPDEADNCILLNEPTKINQQKTDKPRGKSINFNVGNQQRDRNRDCQTMACGTGHELETLKKFFLMDCKTKIRIWDRNLCGSQT